jgi:hypothetical protein
MRIDTDRDQDLDLGFVPGHSCGDIPEHRGGGHYEQIVIRLVRVGAAGDEREA